MYVCVSVEMHIIKTRNIDKGGSIKLCYIDRKKYITENSNCCKILYLPDKSDKTKLRSMRKENYIKKLFYNCSSASEATDHALDGKGLITGKDVGSLFFKTMSEIVLGVIQLTDGEMGHFPDCKGDHRTA